MADKEATVYIVDVGASMSEKNNGREETDLEWAMNYVWDKITTTVATGRKTTYVGVLGLRTDETNNDLQEDENYQHISVLQPLSQILMPDLRKLRDEIRPSSTDDGDAVSALIVAIQMIAMHCRKLKYKRKIVLVTNGRGQMDFEDISGIISKMKEDDIELVVLGVDFDDAEYGFKEEEKDAVKAENEAALRSLVEECGGAYGTMEQAINELGIPRIKNTRPVSSFRGALTLGDPENYDSAMSIDVERYPRTMVAKPPTASSFVVRTDLAPQESSTQTSHTLPNGDVEMSDNQDGLAAVKNARTYQVVDEEAPGGKRDVELEDLAKGYEYGRTAVAISESEHNVTKLGTHSGLDIVGFVPRDKYDRYMNMSRSNVVVAQRTNEKASMALSSFIHALYELDSYAVARLVAKDGNDPKLLLLAPSIEPDYECLLDVELPFAEDVRQYRFPPLDRVITVSGKQLIEHRNLPSDELMKAMSDYVDHMDLSTFGKDDEGNPAEYMPMEDTFSPVLHRINQAIRWRAVHPTEPIPPPYEILTRYSAPPEELLQQAQPYLNAVLKAADVKKVPPKQKGRKRHREAEKPLSGLNVEELLGREKRQKISAENAIPEFKQMLATTEDIGTIKDAAKQIGSIIQSYIRHSVGDSGYKRAVEAIRVVREEMTELEEPGVFNDLIRDLKTKILGEELGGDRKEMWWLVRANRLGLIDKRMSPLSEVEEDEAKAFLTAKLS
ncbi:ATP-dependent DNA helicase yku80 [Coniosporium tulheliwenetii]|uniref:ATP-dependent DNA helicase yku80 n=1 Tax=Coniosporium tulheliwenetii TaxID=3383036 RepID=A0ACC2YQ05_9PEZI|nr:ATP-dependent DNA helicase yku80 [Cladosporium sp. JES 115]